MSAWPPIDRDDLRHAAGSDGFPGLLPQLVRRLIAETAEGITELDMPGEGGVAVGGFDGVVTAERATVEVPAGTSVWELSVEKNCGTKADSDYSKRQVGPDGRRATDITYVQLILATWTKASAWAAGRSEEGHWRAVRALNLDAVRGWLDRAPATAVWLADRLGKSVPGARLADDWFDRTWLPSTRVPLGPAVVLAGRVHAAERLVAELGAGKPALTVTGDLGSDEFRAFVAAAIDQADGQQAATLKARTLLVDNAEALARLTGLAQPLVLVLADARLAASAPGGGPHQIVVLAPPGGDADVVVDRVDTRLVAGLLVGAGEPRQRADDLGALARRSVPALRRVLALQPATLRPAWADSPDHVRRRLALLGGWDGANADDRALLEKVTGRRWPEVQDAALSLTGSDGPPMLGRLGETWYLVSPSDTWLLLHPGLTRDDIGALRGAALEVLTEPDPLYGLDAVEAIRAQMQGRRRRYSSALRRGLARSLALLGASFAPVQATGASTGAEAARHIVRELLTRANADASYAAWTSLSPVLGDLAEAAPEEFLDAMTAGLLGSEPLHARMFTDGNEDDGGRFGPPAGHSAFLWAIETVAWSPEYFDEAVDVLAALAELDPGGRYSNRPARSLQDIFSCWKPTTSAGREQREQALRRLLRDRPRGARALLLALLPDGHDVQIGHSGPRYRDWKHEPVLTGADVDRNARAVGGLILDSLPDDPQELLAAIGKVDDFAPEHRRRLCERLSSLGATLTDEMERATLSAALRAVAARHREYADAAWALRSDEVAPLEEAAAALAPHDPVHRHAWLFTQHWVELGDLSRRDDYEAYDRHLQDVRAQAVADTVASAGLAGVEALAEGTAFPQLIGTALADSGDAALDRDMLVWLNQDSPRPEVAFAYMAQRIGTAPRTLDDLLAAAAGPYAKAAILRATGDPEEAWARLDALGDEVVWAYWERFPIYGLGAFSAVLEAAQGLARVGRHAAVLALISLNYRRSDTLEAAEIAAEACEALLAATTADPELRTLSRHQFGTIVNLLNRHRHALGHQRLVNIEWQFFPALEFEASAPALHAALCEDPSFFAELVQLAWHPDRPDPSRAPDARDGGADEHVQASGFEADGDPDRTRNARDDDGAVVVQPPRAELAKRAHQILRSWRTVPGLGPDGVVEPQRFDAWVEGARTQLAASGRRAAGDAEIGRILAHAVADPDGTAPPRVVRDLLERVASNDLDNGLEVGIYNRRGLVTRDSLDGGGRERDLAATYRQQAAGAAAWPRTRRLLRNLADSYEQDARQMDDRAERRQRGLDS